MLSTTEKTEYPIFVIEGPDGAGKTSLSEGLQELTGARYIHLTYRFADKMHLYHAAALKLALRYAKEQPVIIDRWWPSEIVYADAYRGGSKFAKHFILLEHLATQAGLVYVFCLPSDKQQYVKHYNVLKDNREEMYSSGMDKVYDGYLEIFNEYFIARDNVCHYDMFLNYYEDETTRKIVMSDICQNILEFTEDYRNDF